MLKKKNEPQHTYTAKQRELNESKVKFVKKRLNLNYCEFEIRVIINADIYLILSYCDSINLARYDRYTL